MNKLTPHPYCTVNCILFPIETQREGSGRLGSPLTKRQPRGSRGSGGLRRGRGRGARERKRKSEKPLQSRPLQSSAGRGLRAAQALWPPIASAPPSRSRRQAQRKRERARKGCRVWPLVRTSCTLNPFPLLGASRGALAASPLTVTPGTEQVLLKHLLNAVNVVPMTGPSGKGLPRGSGRGW